MTRQEIADQVEALHSQYQDACKAANAAMDAEKALLQAACGEIGHVFRPSYMVGGHRRCAICDQWAPTVTAASPLVAEA